MRYLLLLALSLAGLHLAAHSQSSSWCRNDGAGNIFCYSSDGRRLRITDDGVGGTNVTTTDDWGVPQCRARSDGFGNITSFCW